MSVKTAPLVDRRDARMTEDERATFIESMEENLSKPCLEVHGRTSNRWEPCGVGTLNSGNSRGVHEVVVGSLTLRIAMPSGSWLTGMTLLMVRAAFLPQ